MTEKVKSNISGETRSRMTSQIFSWSPLPPRKKLDFTNKSKVTKSSNNKIGDDKEPYYPNCEFQIWLRSCEQEIVEPIDGQLKALHQNLAREILLSPKVRNRTEGGFTSWGYDGMHETYNSSIIVVETRTIPRWLNGSLLRNGPGSLKAGEDDFQHLFDSSALLHRFGIKDGKVTYQCRFLQSDIYKKIWAANRLVVTEFGTKAVPDPCHSIFQRVATLFSLKSDMSDNAMISLYPFGDEIYAFNEIPFIHRIDPRTLDTLERIDLGENINIVNHTSHPHVMEDGSVYNIGMSIYTTGPYFSVVHFPKKDPSSQKSMFENAKIVASIPARWPLHPSYMHTFGITDNYFIIVEQPLSVSLPSLIALKFQNEPLAGAFRWYGEQYTQINVVSKQTGKLAKMFLAETFFYLHIINQYEESDHVVIDICAYRDPSMLECMYFETMRNMQANPDYAKMFRGRPIRFVLPLEPNPQEIAGDINLITLEDTTATAHYLVDGNIFVKAEKLCELGCETPRINYEKYLGTYYRYFYAISSDVDAENPGTVIKVDLETKTCKTWHERNCYPGEPIFVPSPDSKFEDDGIVLSVMVWGQEDANRVGLLVLDAHTFEEIGRAEFKTSSPVPKCLHGWYLPDSI